MLTTTIDPYVLVRRPSPRLADGVVTHIERSTDVDPARAVQQWQAYVDVLGEAGYRIHEVAPVPQCPDGVFVEDALVVFGDLAVGTSPGEAARAAEVAGAGESAVASGLTLVHLEQGCPPDAAQRGDHASTAEPGEGDRGPARLDGGDVLKIGDTAYVGVGGRTTWAGARALERLVGPRGWRVLPVPISSTLHLKSQVTALPDGTVVGYPPLVDDPARWPAFLPMPEPDGAHVVPLSHDTVVMSDAAPASAHLLRQRGMKVVEVAISEFTKMEGCVTCLSVRVHPYD